MSVTYEMMKNAVREIIENDLTENQRMQLHNEYCNKNNYNDDRIYHFDDIDELFCETKPTKIIEIFSDIEDCEYWYFNGYGNAVECDIDDMLDIENIIDYILEDSDNLYFSEFDDIISLNDNIDEIKIDIENYIDEHDNAAKEENTSFFVMDEFFISPFESIIKHYSDFEFEDNGDFIFELVEEMGR